MGMKAHYSTMCTIHTVIRSLLVSNLNAGGPSKMPLRFLSVTNKKSKILLRLQTLRLERGSLLWRDLDSEDTMHLLH